MTNHISKLSIPFSFAPDLSNRGGALNTEDTDIITFPPKTSIFMRTMRTIRISSLTAGFIQLLQGELIFLAGIQGTPFSRDTYFRLTYAFLMGGGEALGGSCSRIGMQERCLLSFLSLSLFGGGLDGGKGVGSPPLFTLYIQARSQEPGLGSPYDTSMIVIGSPIGGGLNGGRIYVLFI